MTMAIRRQRGMTLVELMISVSIGLVVMAGVLQLYQTATQTQRAQEGMARIQENMRYLFARLEQDVSQTGFSGCMPFEADRVTNVLGNNAGVGQTFDFTTIVGGTDASGPRNSDSLVLRYANASNQIPVTAHSDPEAPITIDNSFTAYGGLNQFDVVMVSDCSRAAVFMITNDPSASAGIIEHALTPASQDGQFNTELDLQNMFLTDQIQVGGSRAFLMGGGNSVGAYQWNLGTSAAGTDAGGACADATPQFCALFRNGVELAEGVEDFQIQFGWMQGGTLRIDDPQAGFTVGDWNAVDRIVVTLTLNSIERAPSLQGGNLSSKTVSKTIMLQNQLPKT